MRQFTKSLILLGAVGCLWLVGADAQMARASPIVVSLVGAPINNGNGTFTWTYSASIAANERIQEGPNSDTPSRPDFFTIYDFLGLVGTPTAPAGWVVTVQNTGITPANASPPNGDNPALPNVTFTYGDGAPPLLPNILGPTVVPGTFQIISTNGGVNIDGSFAGETTFNGGVQDNTNIYSSGSVPVPIPEPATILLVLAGPVFVVGAVRRFCRPRKDPAPEIG